MKRRPWPILLLALCQWMCLPGNLVAGAWGSHMSMGQYWMVSLHAFGPWGMLLNFLLPPLVSGCAVYAVKPWSYPVYFACALVSSYLSIASAIHSSADKVGYLIVILASILNLAVGAFLLLPRTMKPFYQQRLRWWEANPRYAVDLAAQVYAGLGFTEGGEGRILNISLGGALLECRSAAPNGPEPFPRVFGGDVISINIRGPVQDGRDLFCEARVVYLSRFRHIHSGHVARLGLEFQELPNQSRDNLGRLIGALEILKAPFLREKTGLVADLKFWWNEFVSTPQANPVAPADSGSAKAPDVVPGDAGGGSNKAA
jgi:hypothetical protein